MGLTPNTVCNVGDLFVVTTWGHPAGRVMVLKYPNQPGLYTLNRISNLWDGRRDVHDFDGDQLYEFPMKDVRKISFAADTLKNKLDNILSSKAHVKKDLIEFLLRKVNPRDATAVPDKLVQFLLKRE